MASRAKLHDRALGVLLAGALVALVGYALIAGLGVRVPAAVHDRLRLFTVAPPAPPPPEVIAPKPAVAPKREGAAAPPNLTAKASEIVAPPPVLSVSPPPVIVAPVAGLGAERSQGAAPVPGPGTGAGGQGNGTGAGGSGDGDGGGGGEIPLRLIRGRLRYGDLPRALIDDDAQGTVDMRFDVDATGRVARCTVTRSSGNRALDAATCRLVVDKLRYRPTRDASGRAVPDYVIGRQEWTATRQAEEDEQ